MSNFELIARAESVLIDSAQLRIWCRVTDPAEFDRLDYTSTAAAIAVEHLTGRAILVQSRRSRNADGIFFVDPSARDFIFHDAQGVVTPGIPAPTITRGINRKTKIEAYGASSVEYDCGPEVLPKGVKVLVYSLTKFWYEKQDAYQEKSLIVSPSFASLANAMKVY